MLNNISLGELEEILLTPSLQCLSGEKILITGGAGFLGSWLSDALIELGVSLVCVDNLSSGSINNISHLKRSKRFRFIQADVEELEKAVHEDGFKCILHLASRASPEDYQAYPVETLTANSLGTLRALEVARRHSSTFLFASTSEVYGDAELIPTPEDYWGKVNPIGPRSPYDESKRFSEALCKAYERKHGLDVRILRIFNSFGPRLRPEGLYGRAVSRFIMQAVEGAPITVYGDGSQTRSFCYVTDTVKGILQALTRDSARGEVFNIGNPEETSILELATRIKTLTCSNSTITFHPLPEDDPRRRCPDISKAKRMLDWQPEIRLEEGLRRTISWFRTDLAQRLSKKAMGEE
ncbi:MAG: UDP-glucuronic acid decarboxylase family protein [Candidatus Bathyarchaeia archaeon]